MLAALLPAAAETLRVATFAAPLSRAGPGLLLRDILRGGDAGIDATIAQIAAVAPDILVLTAFDHDAGGAALAAFRDALALAGVDLPHGFSLLPNSGMASGLDLDGDGRLGDAGDAQGFGRFAGQAGLAILSRWPVDAGGVRDFSALLWRDLPGATLPQGDGRPFPSAEAQAAQRLSSTGHWIVPVLAPGGPVDLMVWSATPPVFDGPEDRNGLRARDELRLWQVVLDGALGPPPGRFFVLAGNANLDPFGGDGDRAAMAAFLADPRLTDPGQASAGARTAANAGGTGPPGQATASWEDPGNLRVSYVLPAAAWEVTDAGVFWPGPDDPLAPLMGPDGRAAGPHRIVWADLRRPRRRPGGRRPPRSGAAGVADAVVGDGHGLEHGVDRHPRRKAQRNGRTAGDPGDDAFRPEHEAHDHARAFVGKVADGRGQDVEGRNPLGPLPRDHHVLRKDAQAQGLARRGPDPHQPERPRRRIDRSQPVVVLAPDAGGDDRAQIAPSEGRGGAGIGQDARRRTRGGDAPGFDQDHGGGKAGDLGCGMADIEDRQAGLVAQPFEIGQDLGLAGLVERGEGFVHHQNARPGQQRPAQRHALPFAPGQCARPSPEQSADPEERGHLIGVRPLPVAREPPSVKEIAPHIEMREQPRILKHAADPAPVRRHPEAPHRIEKADPSGVDPPGIGAQQPGDGVDDGALARTGRARQRGDPRRGLERDIKGEIRKGVAQAHGQGHVVPILRAIACDSHSDRISAAIAIPRETHTSRIAAGAPPGTCNSA